MELRYSDRFENMSGSAIRAIFALLQNPDIISFGGGNPAGEAFPGEQLSAIAEKLIKQSPQIILQYGQTEGYGPLKKTIAKIYNVKEDMIQMTVGAQQAIDLTCKAMLDKDDFILVENPTFLGALQTFKMYQPQIKAVNTDEKGMIIEDLEAKIKKYNPKLLYVIPNFQNPTGITTSLDRRQAMSDLADKYNVLIIEDDPYGKLRYEGEDLPSIFNLNKNGKALYLASFSKTISPGLRVGAAIGNPDIISKMTIGAQTTTVHCPILTQAMVNEYLNSGDYEIHLKNMCSLYKSRRDNMVSLIKELIPGVTCTHPEGGLFLWIKLPSGMDSRELFKKAVENNVAFVSGGSFYCENPQYDTLRLNFSFVDQERAKTGIERLAKVIKEFT